MRLSKSLLAIAAASTLAAGTAFAEDSRPADLLGDEPSLLNEDWGYGEQESLAEAVPDDQQTNG